jgi:hypothetical protein
MKVRYLKKDDFFESETGKTRKIRIHRKNGQSIIEHWANEKPKKGDFLDLLNQTVRRRLKGVEKYSAEKRYRIVQEMIMDIMSFNVATMIALHFAKDCIEKELEKVKSK